MIAEARARYEAAHEWAMARRRTFGYGVSRPRGPKHLGSQVEATFVSDLNELGWKVAVLFDEENHR